MNHKFHKPNLRRGWNGEGKQARRDAVKREFVYLKRKLLLGESGL